MKKGVFEGPYLVLCLVLTVFLLGSTMVSAQDGTTVSPPQQWPQLVDITASTGIKFEHLSSPEQKYIVESMSGGVALIDYDRDGWPDIYFTNAQSVSMALAGQKARSALYHNNHDGTFTDVTDKAGVAYPCWAMGASVGDYNNDGFPDLLVTCFGGVVLYRNNGDGSFTDVTKQAGLGNDSEWATGAAFGDYDNDGYVDLFVSHYVDLSLKNLPEFGSSKTCKYHSIDVQCGPRGLKGSPDNLYHNNGDGTFTDISKKAGVDDAQNRFGLTATWVDFNNDGYLDLFVTNDGQPNYLYRNDGNGHFTDVAYVSGAAVSQDGVEQANMGIALADYQHTGHFSVGITHFSDEYMALYRNDGGMNFTDASYLSGIAPSTTPYVGWGDGFFDLDNDGWQDFFMVNGHVYPQVDILNINVKYREPKLLFLNQHDGTFKNISKLAGPAIQVPEVSRGTAFGDLFNDGRVDIVIESLEGQPMVLRPQGGPANHWINFELEGTKSNRLALNARVKITTGSLIQTDQVLSGGSYLSQNDLRLHFGLGNLAQVDKAEIIWPTGKSEVLNNLAANHFYKIKEGNGIVSTNVAQGSAGDHPPAVDVPKVKTPILVELFTSEGCPSCPPADALVAYMDSAQPVPGGQVIVLSEHVDYYDRVDWRDPYSSAFFSNRQKAYKRALKAESVYTPQMIVDGSNELHGNNPQQARQVLENAVSAEKFPVHISSVSFDAGAPDTVRVHVEVEGKSSQRNADIFVASVLDHVDSTVEHAQPHVAVVQNLTKIGEMERGKDFSQDIEVKLKPGSETTNTRIIAFVQESGPGKVLGAAMRKISH